MSMPLAQHHPTYVSRTVFCQFCQNTVVAV
jgi:hypothetical protein